MELGFQLVKFNTSKEFRKPYKRFYTNQNRYVEPEDSKYYYDIEDTYYNTSCIARNAYDSSRPILFGFRSTETILAGGLGKGYAENGDTEEIVVFQSAWISKDDYILLLTNNYNEFPEPINRSYEWVFWDCRGKKLVNNVSFLIPEMPQEAIYEPRYTEADLDEINHREDYSTTGLLTMFFMFTPCVLSFSWIITYGTTDILWVAFVILAVLIAVIELAFFSFHHSILLNDKRVEIEQEIERAIEHENIKWEHIQKYSDYVNVVKNYLDEVSKL